MQVWLETSLTQVNVTSKLGSALRYLNNNWVRLTRFLEDGIIPLDNNAAENAIRPFVVGRKNWLHSNSVKGANELEPYAYLSYIIKERALVKTIEQFESLLPWNVKNEHLAYWH